MQLWYCRCSTCHCRGKRSASGINGSWMWAGRITWLLRWNDSAPSAGRWIRGFKQIRSTSPSFIQSTTFLSFVCSYYTYGGWDIVFHSRLDSITRPVHVSLRDSGNCNEKAECGLFTFPLIKAGHSFFVWMVITFWNSNWMLVMAISYLAGFSLRKLKVNPLGDISLTSLLSYL